MRSEKDDIDHKSATITNSEKLILMLKNAAICLLLWGIANAHKKNVINAGKNAVMGITRYVHSNEFQKFENFRSNWSTSLFKREYLFLKEKPMYLQSIELQNIEYT